MLRTLFSSECRHNRTGKGSRGGGARLPQHIFTLCICPAAALPRSWGRRSWTGGQLGLDVSPLPQAVCTAATAQGDKDTRKVGDGVGGGG